MRGTVVAVVAGLGFAAPALAEDCAAPCVGSTLSIEISDDWIWRADPAELKSNSLQPEVGIESFFMPTDNLKLVSNIAIDQVIDPEPGESSAFDHIGVYVAELYAEAGFEPVTLKAGKFDPVFSLASAVADGIHSTDLAGNADMGESLAAQGTVDFEALELNHALTGTAFSMDRSILAESLVTDRHEPRLRDGGAGNTTGISSFSLVLDGCKGADVGDCHEEGDYGYRLGARFQRHGRAIEPEEDEDPVTPENELALLWAAHKSFEINDVALRLIGEGAYLRHFEGGPDDALILTGIAALVDGPMTYSAGLSAQFNRVAGDGDTKERLGEIAFKYSPEDGGPIPGATWSIGGGYALAIDDEEQSAHTVSLRLNLELAGTKELR